jgi:hypothetical protein
MSNSAKTQVQTVSQAMQAVDTRKGVKPEPTIGGSNWHTKFIGYVAEAQQSGKPLHCASQAEAQELDIASGEDLGMKSPDNPRLAHPWGAQLLGLAPYKGTRYAQLVRAGFTDGKFAALKVTK